MTGQCRSRSTAQRTNRAARAGTLLPRGILPPASTPGIRVRWPLSARRSGSRRRAPAMAAGVEPCPDSRRPAPPVCMPAGRCSQPSSRRTCGGRPAPASTARPAATCARRRRTPACRHRRGALPVVPITVGAARRPRMRYLPIPLLAGRSRLTHQVPPTTSSSSPLPPL